MTKTGPEFFTCGGGVVLDGKPAGCGEEFYFTQAYRCVDCDLVCCRRCATEHFKVSGDARRGALVHAQVIAGALEQYISNDADTARAARFRGELRLFDKACAGAEGGKRG